jgi:hypothetical protein
MRSSIFAKLVGAVAMASLGCGGAEVGDEGFDAAVEQEAICVPCVLSLATIVSGVQPTSIALTGTDAYFTNASFPFQLDRIPLGGGATTILSTSSGKMDSATLHGKTVYWANDSATTDSGTWSISTSGTAVPVHISHHDNDLASATEGVAVYDSGSAVLKTPHVLFADSRLATLWDTRISILGTTDVSLLPAHDPQPPHDNYYPYSIVIDATSVYFTHDQNEGLYKAPIGGGAVTKLSGNTVARDALALDGGKLYFQEGSDIKSMSTSGGAIATFVAGVGTVSAMVANSGSIYWTCSSCGTVSKKSVSGGSVTTLASGQSSPSCLAVNDSYVYFGTKNALRRVAK